MSVVASVNGAELIALPTTAMSCDVCVQVASPGEVLNREVMRYLASCDSETGVCGEHDPRWLDVLHDGLGHRPYMVVARRGRAICGYLPLTLVTSRLFGRFLVSLPYLNRAGIVADDAATARQLIDEAVELSQEVDAQYLELRHHQPPMSHEKLPVAKDEKVRMVMPLPADREFLWKTLGSKVRNQVRKGEQQNLVMQWGGGELVDAFYDVFAVNMRDLGTPVYPQRMFEKIVEAFGDDAELGVVRQNGQAIAGALLVHSDLGGERVTQVPSASCLRRFNSTNANMWMYYHLLERAIERGSTSFDFGRSSVDSGPYRFKKQWGALPQPTVWQYHVRRGVVGDVRPDNPRYRRRIALWQKMPVWLTRIMGPRIIRGIP